jgi:Na+/H+-dicarboxylate symporter
MASALRKFPFSLQILLGLVLVVALGFLARANDLSWLASTLDTVGGLFVQLLKLAVPPLVFTAIVVSVVSLRGVPRRWLAGSPAGSASLR